LGASADHGPVSDPLLSSVTTPAGNFEPHAANICPKQDARVVIESADFTEIDRMSIATHLWHLVNLQVVVAEIFGAALLWWSVRRTRADGTGSAT